jgi:hypothetical protein
MNTNNAWPWSGSKRLNQWWYYTFWWTKLSFPFERTDTISCYRKLPHKLAEKMWLVVVGTRHFSEGLGRLIEDSSGAAVCRGLPPVDAPVKKSYCKMKIPYEFSIMYSNWIQSVLWIQILLFFEPGSGIRNRFFQGAGSRIPDIKDIWDVNDNF